MALYQSSQRPRVEEGQFVHAFARAEFFFGMAKIVFHPWWNIQPCCGALWVLVRGKTKAGCESLQCQESHHQWLSIIGREAEKHCTLQLSYRTPLGHVNCDRGDWQDCFEGYLGLRITPSQTREPYSWWLISCKKPLCNLDRLNIILVCFLLYLQTHIALVQCDSIIGYTVTDGTSIFSLQTPRRRWLTKTG